VGGLTPTWRVLIFPPRPTFDIVDAFMTMPVSLLWMPLLLRTKGLRAGGTATTKFLLVRFEKTRATYRALFSRTSCRRMRSGTYGT
jgi:hypothetical protein